MTCKIKVTAFDMTGIFPGVLTICIAFVLQLQLPGLGPMLFPLLFSVFFPRFYSLSVADLEYASSGRHLVLAERQ